MEARGKCRWKQKEYWLDLRLGGSLNFWENLWKSEEFSSKSHKVFLPYNFEHFGKYQNLLIFQNFIKWSDFLLFLCFSTYYDSYELIHRLKICVRLFFFVSCFCKHSNSCYGYLRDLVLSQLCYIFVNLNWSCWRKFIGINFPYHLKKTTPKVSSTERSYVNSKTKLLILHQVSLELTLIASFCSNKILIKQQRNGSYGYGNVVFVVKVLTAD